MLKQCLYSNPQTTARCNSFLASVLPTTYMKLALQLVPLMYREY